MLRFYVRWINKQFNFLKSTEVMDITAVMGSIEVFKCEMKDQKAQVQWFAPNGSEINMKNFRFFILIL